jgi:pimeloyl-ACP methyl ester carboxylesterase
METGLSEWWAVVPALARDRAVVLIDLPGHGQHGRKAPPGSTFPALAEVVAELLERRNFAPAHLIGHSNGANVVLELVIRRPELAASCVLQAGNATVGPALIEAMTRLDPDRLRVDSPEACARWRRLHGASGGVEAWPALLAAAAAAACDGPNLGVEQLAAMRVPTLVVEGADDDVNAPLGHARYLVEHLPDARSWRPEGRGHAVHTEDPQGWVAVIGQFLQANEVEPSAPRDGWAVAAGILDMRRCPDGRSERISQLLCGEEVEVGESGRGWTQVRAHRDGCEGWVRSAGLSPIPASWPPAPLARITHDWVPWSADPDGSVAGRLPLGASLPVVARRGPSTCLLAPDGTHRWVSSDAVTSPSSIGSDTGAALHRLRQLVGVPYLWGGRSPYGFDCSGLAQAFGDLLGTPLPRDAHDQYQAVTPIPGPPEPGDLIFFHDPGGRDTDPVTHVGIALDTTRMIHAWAVPAAVVITSYADPSAEPLAGLLVGFGRPARWGVR